MGKAVTYLSNTLVKLEAGSKLDEEKQYHIKGFIIDAILVKSRSNTAGLRFNMIFEQSKGINNVLTNFENVKTMSKKIKSGAWCKMEGYENSFRQYEVEDLYKNDKEFRELFDKHVDDVYSELLNELTLNETLEDRLVPLEEDESILLDEKEGLYYSYDENDELVQVEVVEE